MEKRKLKNPRKVVWVMRDFLNEISDLTYISNADDFDGENYINPMREKQMAKLTKGKAFSAYVCGEYGSLEKCFEITYNFESLCDELTKDFRRDFTRRCPLAKGFADITITLLHELGHFYTDKESRKVWSIADRLRELGRLRLDYWTKKIDIHQLQIAYYLFPDEKMATDWAIEWLKDPAHRKIAKAFEKKFFACFKRA